MSNSNTSQPEGSGKEYNPSVLSQETLVGSDTNSLHPLVRNNDGAATSADASPGAAGSFYYVSTRVVKEIPRSATPTDPSSTLGKLKKLLKPPAVKAAEGVPSRVGKTYHVDEQGQIIETTTTKAG